MNLRNLAFGAAQRSLIILALALVTLPAGAQRRTFSSGPAVVDSTLTVFPQINETYSTRPMKPSNPKLPLLTGPANTLAVDGGTLRGLERITPSTKFPGINATGWSPPDPTLAAGPNNIVVTVNSTVAFFSKSGTRQFQQDLGPGGFFASVNPTSFVFDPKVFYDHIAKRFVIVCPELDQGGVQSKCLVAVSDDTDPNGTWFKYRIEAKVSSNGNDFWLDYPGWGYNKDAYVITGNMFNFGSGPFGGVQYIVLPKAPLLTGDAATVTSIIDGASFTAQVCHTMDSTLDRIYAISQQSNTQLRVHCVRNLTTSPTLSSINLGIPQFNGNSVAISKGGAQLDTVGSRLISSYYRSSKIVAAHTVGVSNNDNRASVRWYEVDVKSWPTTGTPALVQSGQIIPPSGEHYWMPGICVNKQGDISLTFSRCSANVAADMMTAGRKKTDPAGSMGQPKSVFTSPGQFGSGGHRWGDYAEVCTDPNDDSTFWGVVQTIAANNNWSTEVQKWTVSIGGDPANLVPATAVSTYQGDYVGGTLADVRTNNEVFYQVAATPVLRLGNVAATQINFKTTVPVSTINAIEVNIEAVTDLSVGATGMIWLYNWGTGAWDHKKSFTLYGTGQGSQKYFVSTGVGNYLNSAGEVKLVVRGLAPQGSGSPKAFVLKVDNAFLALGTN